MTTVLSSALPVEPLVRVEGLTIELGGRKPVRLVQDLSFSIRPGECLGLVGESGSGKSLTSRALIGLNAPVLRQSARRFDILGHDFRAVSESRWQALRGTAIGYVLQDALGAFDPLRSIFSELRETLDAHRIGPASGRRGKVVQALERVGFPEPEVRARQHSWQLSGGLRQRALIASAIVASPRLLIADEPTTALDVNIQARIIDLLQELKQAGMGLLFVSHDLAVVSTVADHVVVMNEGRAVEQGPTAQVLENPAHDYTRMLIAAMPSRAPVGARLSSVALPPGSVFQSSRVRSAGDAPALSARGLHKSYILPDGSRVGAVLDVSFDLQRGEILGLVGGSGSGKSTIVKLCMALVEPDEGEIALFGQPWTSLPEKQRTARRPRIQLIAQDPLGAFDPRFTVRRLLSEALAIGGVPAGEHDAETRRLLAAVGLRDELIDRLPRNMSGGQRQRVAIARALATRPEVLVCDEPVSALDVSVQAQILDLLSLIHRETGLSILFISHDLSVVRHLCGRVMVMHKGEIVEEGTAEDIFSNVRHPYTRELIAAIPRMGADATAAPAAP